jgi:hypothetical protein
MQLIEFEMPRMKSYMGPLTNHAKICPSFENRQLGTEVVSVDGVEMAMRVY